MSHEQIQSANRLIYSANIAYANEILGNLYGIEGGTLANLVA